MVNFVVKKQESISQTQAETNGVRKDVFVVAKSLPFVFHLHGDFAEGSSITLGLFYDMTPPKEVGSTPGVPEPVNYEVHTISPNERAVTCRLKVLSSQHNRALFKVKITHTLKGKSYHVYSGSIKVTSKRRQAEQAPEQERIKQEQVQEGSVTERKLPPRIVSSDSVMKSLERIERSQFEFQRKIEMQMEKLQNQFREEPSTKRVRVDTSITVEDAFTGLVTQLNLLPEAQRKEILHRLLKSNSHLVPCLVPSESPQPLDWGTLSNPDTPESHDGNELGDLMIPPTSYCSDLGLNDGTSFPSVYQAEYVPEFSSSMVSNEALLDTPDLESWNN
jgi:hypothetical protein